jgi:hypothetical protein
MTTDGLELLRCRQCGAALGYAAGGAGPGTAILACAFCGSTYIYRVEGAPAGAGAGVPRGVPFTLAPAEARTRFDGWLAGGLVRPGDLGRAAQVHAPAAVFVPAYLGRARAHSNWTAAVVTGGASARVEASPREANPQPVRPPAADAGGPDEMRDRDARVQDLDLDLDVPRPWPWPGGGGRRRRGRVRVRTQVLSGAHDADYSHVCLPASRGVAEADFLAIAGYDWSKLRPIGLDPEAGPQGPPAAFGRLPDARPPAPLEEPALGYAEAQARIREQIEQSEREACRRMVPGGGPSELAVNTLLTDLVVELVHLPLYVVCYEYRGKPYRALVNGSTGQVAGRAPLSAARLAAAAAALLAVPAVVAWFLWRRRA